MAIAGAIGIITANEIANGAVSNDKLGSDISITNAQLAGSIANAKLVNDSVTVNGTSIDLGASETITAGKVLQVVSATSTSPKSTTSTSFVDTNLSASITPSSSSNKVLVLVQGQMYIATDGGQAVTTILRGTTNLGNSDRGMMQHSDFEDRFQANDSMIYLDSPSATTSTTYKVQIKVYSGSHTIHFGVDNTPQTMTLLEIEG